jgi:hypothetical protein
MDDGLIAILVMRGVVRITVVLTAGMCLILAWKLVGKLFEHPVRDGAKGWRRLLIHLCRALPIAVLVSVAAWLLSAVMRPVTAHLSEAPCPTDAHSTTPPVNPLCACREYTYEDSGI